MATRILVVAAGLLLTLVASAVSAQESGTTRDDRGLYLGMRVGGANLHLDELTATPLLINDAGGNAQLFLGWQFTGVFALEVVVGVAGYETSLPDEKAGVGSFQMFGVYRFAEGSRFRPYLKGGFGAYGIGLTGSSNDDPIEGGGVAFGGGFEVFVFSHLALGLDFTHHIIEYQSVDLKIDGVTIPSNLEEESSMTSIALSLAVYF